LQLAGRPCSLRESIRPGDLGFAQDHIQLTAGMARGIAELVDASSEAQAASAAITFVVQLPPAHFGHSLPFGHRTPPEVIAPMSRPKYVIVIPDGAADEPFAALGNLTPLQAARLPEMDRIAGNGIVGRSRNVPDRFLPASDVATLSLFGYDPERYYTGRAPLEAAAMGIALGPDDWAVRCNLMTIRDRRLTDFTAGHITSDEGRPLIEAIQAELGSPQIEFHPGVSYRNLMIYRGRPDENPFTDETITDPPHDHPDQPAAEHRPRGPGAALLIGLMSRASEVLRAHRVNQARVAAGKPPANAIWLWGQGRAPSMPHFSQLHRLDGSIISAVDLVRGVGVLAGWVRIDVPGATGYLDTDYAAKGRFGVQALQQHDVVCVHIEAPDEASHEGRHQAKVEALERIDREIVGPIRKALESFDEWRILISPDHSTLLRTRAHDRAPVAWAMAGTGLTASGKTYDELAAKAAGGPYFDQGYQLMNRFLDLSWDGRT
jgi:2,3-bisphosphoglycerate-independent phosphoglycerate mutase